MRGFTLTSLYEPKWGDGYNFSGDPPCTAMGGHCQSTFGLRARQSTGGRPVFVRSLGSEGRWSLEEAGPLFVRIPAGTEGTKGPGVEVDR